MKLPPILLLFLASLFPVGLSGAEPAIHYGDNPAAGRYYDVRGFRMYVETYGTGSPVLMIHGNGGDIGAFWAIIPYFAARHRVIAVDSRSQGKSLDPGHPITFEMMADDFAALLDTMHVPAAYVIGWSDGGINALLLAMRHPDKVLALASSGANLWPAADAFAPGVWHNDFEVPLQEPPPVLKTADERNGRKMFMLDATEPHIALADLRGVRCPALIICGDHDMISIEHTVAIYRHIPKAELWVVPDSGHATLMEHSAEFSDKVETFFTTPFHVRSD